MSAKTKLTIDNCKFPIGNCQLSIVNCQYSLVARYLYRGGYSEPLGYQPRHGKYNYRKRFRPKHVVFPMK